MFVYVYLCACVCFSVSLYVSNMCVTAAAERNTQKNKRDVTHGMTSLAMDVPLFVQDGTPRAPVER